MKRPVTLVQGFRPLEHLQAYSRTGGHPHAQKERTTPVLLMSFFLEWMTSVTGTAWILAHLHLQHRGRIAQERAL